MAGPVYYPLFADLTGKLCVVVGGGQVAERKARSLLECGAKVTVISPKLTARLLELSDYGEIIHAAREFRKGDLKGAWLAIGATDDRRINEEVFKEATRRGILVNVVDAPSMCNFIVPSVVRRGELTLAISTGGTIPALAKRIRRELQEYFGPEYTEYLRLVGRARREIRDRYCDADDRARALERVLESDALELLRKGKRSEAEERIKRCI